MSVKITSKRQVTFPARLLDARERARPVAPMLIVHRKGALL